MEQCERYALLLQLLLLMEVVVGRMVRVEWDTSNPLLHSTEPIVVNQNLELNTYDQAHFICPENSSDTFSVFSVYREEFKLCTLLKPRSSYKKIAECGPRHRGLPPILISFRQFSPLPGGMEFLPGEIYYFLTIREPTSNRDPSNPFRDPNSSFRGSNRDSSSSFSDASFTVQSSHQSQCQVNLRISFLISATRLSINVPRLSAESGVESHKDLMNSIQTYVRPLYPDQDAEQDPEQDVEPLLLEDLGPHYPPVNKPKRAPQIGQSVVNERYGHPAVSERSYSAAPSRHVGSFSLCLCVIYFYLLTV